MIMTEQEWLTGDDHRGMMYFLRDKASVRKLQLFACACCRRVKWYHQHPIEMLEGYADRQVKRKAAMAAVKAAIPEGGIDAYCKYLFWSDKCHYGADSASAFCIQGAVYSRGAEYSPANRQAEDRVHAVLLRDLFNNPFRPVTLNPVWLTPATVPVAQAAYNERDLPSGHLDCARLAVLADTLEDAGCADEAILGHLRGPGPHVRGCWAVDLILGRK